MTWDELHKQYPGQVQEPRIQHLAGYCRRMELDRGNVALTHKHKTDHYSILEAGSVLLRTDGVSTVYYAPAVITIKAGVNHSIEALNDNVVWLCVHVYPLGTDEAATLADEMDRVMIKE